MNIREMMAQKVFSARFLISMLIALSLCYGFIIGKISAEMFAPIALIVVRDYFDRSDRMKEEKLVP